VDSWYRGKTPTLTGFFENQTQGDPMKDPSGFQFLEAKKGFISVVTIAAGLSRRRATQKLNTFGVGASLGMVS